MTLWITAHLAATVAGLPVYDTGMIDSTPDLDEECEPLPMPENIPRDVVRVSHTRGHQSVLVDTPDGLVIIGGDVAYTFHELGCGATEGQRRVLALAAPTWLTHAEGGPKVPRLNQDDDASRSAAFKTTLRRTRGARESSARNAGALKTSRRAGFRVVTLALRRAPVTTAISPK